MIRTALIKAYQRVTGKKVILTGGKERPQTAEIPGILPVDVKPREVKRYESHGIANVKIEMGNFAQTSFVIDVEPLAKIGAIDEIWLKQAPKTLTVHLSCGIQTAKENAEGMDSSRKLEGVLIRTTALSRSKIVSPYETEIIPLYGKSLEFE